MGRNRQQNRQQSNRGKANRGGGSRGAVSRGSAPNRGGGISIHDSQAADDVIADRALSEREFLRSSQAADDVLADLKRGAIGAREISGWGDEARMSIPEHLLPDAPEGMTYSEDRTLVDTDFYR